jgi:hypothetical protein
MRPDIIEAFCEEMPKRACLYCFKHDLSLKDLISFIFTGFLWMTENSHDQIRGNVLIQRLDKYLGIHFRVLF